MESNTRKMVATVGVCALLVLAGCSAGTAGTIAEERTPVETESDRLQVINTLEVDGDEFSIVKDGETGNFCYILRDTSGDAMECLPQSVLDNETGNLTVKTRQSVMDNQMFVIYDSGRDVTCYLKPDEDADSLDCITEQPQG